MLCFAEFLSLHSRLPFSLQNVSLCHVTLENTLSPTAHVKLASRQVRLYCVKRLQRAFTESSRLPVLPCRGRMKARGMDLWQAWNLAEASTSVLSSPGFHSLILQLATPHHHKLPYSTTSPFLRVSIKMSRSAREISSPAEWSTVVEGTKVCVVLCTFYILLPQSLEEAVPPS